MLAARIDDLQILERDVMRMRARIHGRVAPTRAAIEREIQHTHVARAIELHGVATVARHEHRRLILGSGHDDGLRSRPRFTLEQQAVRVRARSETQRIARGETRNDRFIVRWIRIDDGRACTSRECRQRDDQRTRTQRNSWRELLLTSLSSHVCARPGSK